MIEQLKFRCTNKFHLRRINSDLLKEYDNFRKNHQEGEINFTNSCEYGYLNLAKHFYHSGNVDDIKFHFRSSCVDGSLNIVKWLHQIINEDINDLVEDSLYRVCDPEIIEWIDNL